MRPDRFGVVARFGLEAKETHSGIIIQCGECRWRDANAILGSKGEGWGWRGRSHLRLVEVLVRDEGGTEWSEPGRGEGWEVGQKVGVASEDGV